MKKTLIAHSKGLEGSVLNSSNNMIGKVDQNTTIAPNPFKPTPKAGVFTRADLRYLELKQAKAIASQVQLDRESRELSKGHVDKNGWWIPLVAPSGYRETIMNTKIYRGGK